jgi:hypothetical protein
MSPSGRQRKFGLPAGAHDGARSVIHPERTIRIGFAKVCFSAIAACDSAALLTENGQERT